VLRELQGKCPQHGDFLLEMFNGGVDVSHMIAAMDDVDRFNVIDLMALSSAGLLNSTSTSIAGRSGGGHTAASATALRQDAIVEWMLKAYGCEYGPAPRGDPCSRF